MKVNGFTPINPPSRGKPTRAVSVPLDNTGEARIPSAVNSAGNDLPETDDEDDQQTDSAPDDHSTASSNSPVANQQPHPNETILDHCLRMRYIPPDTPIPTTKDSIRPFLALRPLRPLDYNPDCRSRQPWHPGHKKMNQNWYALFTQVAGRVAAQPCAKCARGQAKWLPCVVAPTEETSVNGACGCCLYNNVGSKCSFVKAPGANGARGETRSREVSASSSNDPVTTSSTDPVTAGILDAEPLYEPAVREAPEPSPEFEVLSPRTSATDPGPDPTAAAAASKKAGGDVFSRLPDIFQDSQRNWAEVERTKIEKALRVNAAEQVRLTNQRTELLRRLEELDEERRPYQKRARPEGDDDHRPSKKQDTKNNSVERKDTSAESSVVAPNYGDASDLAIKTEPNQPAHAASHPNSPAHNPRTHLPTRRTSVPLNRVAQLPSHASPTSMYPNPGEGMLDYCLRRHYLPANHHLSWSSSTAAALRPFLALPPVRKVDRKLAPNSGSWQPPPSDNSNAKYYALFSQVGGRVAPRPCTRCAGGGVKWTPCVVPPTEETAAVVGGACGCCLYNDLGSACSFAQAARPPVEPRPGDRPVQEGGGFSAIVGAQTPYPQPAYPGQQYEYSQRSQLQQQAQQALQARPAWNQSIYASATIPDARQSEPETERSKIDKELHGIADEQLRLATRQKALLKRLEELR
ncbi:hypothetical protein GE09DRAFT_1294224 [Coniochaeta sp. 2T2.1]|nr:hypothetical protein GE09DRAFT_1294224 [Coniochaeta sp. 2T2.1]